MSEVPRRAALRTNKIDVTLPVGSEVECDLLALWRPGRRAGCPILHRRQLDRIQTICGRDVDLEAAAAVRKESEPASVGGKDHVGVLQGRSDEADGRCVIRGRRRRLPEIRIYCITRDEQSIPMPSNRRFSDIVGGYTKRLRISPVAGNSPHCGRPLMIGVEDKFLAIGCPGHSAHLGVQRCQRSRFPPGCRRYLDIVGQETGTGEEG
jgi:hypothetical protein